MTDATQPTPTHRKRVRLAQAVGTLRQQVQLYRSLFAAAALIIAALALFMALGPADPEPISLGTGKAGVMIAERPTPRAADQIEAEDETVAETSERASGAHLGDGGASYYGDELAGNPTASGEAFDPAKLTAAHRTLPLGSRVRVTNLRSGESVIVRINDRGPFHGRRVIDLSKAAARKIGLLRRGTGQVRLELLAAK